MADYHDQDVADKLDDITAALDLLRDAVAQLKRPPTPVVYGVDPAQSAGALAGELWQRLGPRRAKWVRTKLNRIEEKQTGRRSRGGGRDVVANGHAATIDL